MISWWMSPLSSVEAEEIEKVLQERVLAGRRRNSMSVIAKPQLRSIAHTREGEQSVDE